MSSHLSREIENCYARLRLEAAQLAGTTGDLVHRASVYHHLYQHSGGNHAFPLIAAHGALWANWYFRWGMRLGKIFALRYIFDAELRQKRLDDLKAYADAYRNINRQVCIETYAAYYLTDRFGHLPDIGKFLPSTLVENLNRCHVARKGGGYLTREQKRDLFSAFFLWEQETLVGPGVTLATEKFYWPVLKWIALKPSIRFAYFPRHKRLNFRYFACTHERTEKGILAFDIAMDVGLAKVETALRDYGVMPQLFFVDSFAHFDRLKQRCNLV